MGKTLKQGEKVFFSILLFSATIAVMAFIADLALSADSENLFIAKRNWTETFMLRNNGTIIFQVNAPQICNATTNEGGIYYNGTNFLKCAGASGWEEIASSITYTAGTALDLTGTTFSVETTYRLPQACTVNQTTKYNTNTNLWECQDDIGTVDTHNTTEEMQTAVWGTLTLNESNIADLNHNGTVNSDCNATGSCSAGDVAYMNYQNTGSFNISGNISFNRWIGVDEIGLRLTSASDDLTLHADVGGTNHLEIGTDGAFMRLIANPGVANNYLLATFTETQGSNTELNFYEGGTGHNRFWNSGSMRIGGGAGHLCSNLTTDVDCDTPATGADLVVQDEIWLGGKILAGDWPDVIINETQIQDLTHNGTTNTENDTESIQDAIWTNGIGTTTGITVTYQDGTNDVDFETTHNGTVDTHNTTAQMITATETTYVNTTGDTMTGNLNMTDGNLTQIDCIIFQSGGSICDG